MNDLKSFVEYPMIAKFMRYGFSCSWIVTLVIVTMFMSLNFSVTEAHADNVWDAIGISCLPDLNYLSIETMALPLSKNGRVMMDSKSEISDIANRLQSEHSVYSPLSLLSHSFNCKLQAHSISIGLEDYVAPHANGECALLETFEISVSIDNTPSYRFSAYGVNRCTAPEHHFVTVDYLGTLTDCAVSDLGEPQQKALCDTYKFKRP